MQDALERAGRVLTTLSGSYGAYLAVLVFGRFSAAHGTSKLGDRGEAHGRRDFEHWERISVLADLSVRQQPPETPSTDPQCAGAHQGEVTDSYEPLWEPP